MEDVRDRAPACKAEIVIPKGSRGRQSGAAQLACQGVSSAITIAAPLAVVGTPTHDRAWWTEEAGRVGSDWRGIVESHLAVLAQLGLIERGSRQ
jgi:chitodextrinase